MKSIFSRLFTVVRNTTNNPYEDFLTEIFAEVLDYDTLLESFIMKFLLPNSNNVRKIRVGTQVTYLQLDGHIADSRPDLEIHFSQGDDNHLLFIENKIESQEGFLQLSRYADHLKVFESQGYKTHLMYITKFHDPKDSNTFIKPDNPTNFAQLRWYEIYNWLKPYNDDFIYKVLEYMEEMQLNESRRFVPQDMYAIQQMQRLFTMMDWCIDGNVEYKMTELFGKPRVMPTHRFNQLRSAFRYMLYNDLGNDCSIFIGFYLTEDEYPLVCIMFELNPRCKRRTAIVQVMKQFIETHLEWEAEYIDDPAAWCNINCSKELLHFLSNDDHIVSIQTFFIEKLQELAEIKNLIPKLGWRV